jgi:hypothetical protein
MTSRLLDRQVELVRYLTGTSAIFGTADPIAPSLAGIDRRMLDLEARFSFEKRMGKINAVFPRTFALIGPRRDPLIREFIEAQPPVDIDRLVNANQFLEFLQVRWRREKPVPPYLPDVAACEFAFANARIGREEPHRDAASAQSTSQIRRSPAAGLVRCAYDIRPLFEKANDVDLLVARETDLVVVAQPSADSPKIFEVIPEIFELLGVLDEWTDLAELTASDCAETADVVDYLVAAGFVDKHP